MGFAEALGSEFVDSDMCTVGLEAIAGKTLGLYFSAHWCPPCRGFTPKLKEWYAEAKNKGVEIVFVSADESAKAMKDYMKESHGDWLAIEHGTPLSKSLPTKFGVQGIPTLA